MAISIWRADTLERYEKEKSPENGIENALLCEAYSEELLPASWDDAIFWQKKALEIRETLYGKNSAQNIFQYERLAYLYADKLSSANALKWYRKAIRILEKTQGNPLALAKDYVCIADIYMHTPTPDYEACAKNLFHAKQIEEETRPAENPVSFYVWRGLADYYAFRYRGNHKKGEPLPQKPQEDMLAQKDALQKMAASAIKEYGSNSCEAAACLEKYIHDVKLPAQKRLEIAGKILKTYYNNQEFFEHLKKNYDPVSDFLVTTASRIEADIWYSWLTACWFPWNDKECQDLNRSNIGWGIKWIKEHVSEDIAEKIIQTFSSDDREMIWQIIHCPDEKAPVI